MCLLDTENPDLFSKLDQFQRNFSNLSLIAKKRTPLCNSFNRQILPLMQNNEFLNEKVVLENVDIEVINSYIVSTTELKEHSLKLVKELKPLHLNIIFEIDKKYPNHKFIGPTT